MASQAPPHRTTPAPFSAQRRRSRRCLPALPPPPLSGSRSETDGRVHAYDEHEDSTYCVAWSAADPWAFASLSYDGRLVVNKVPKGVKYKVLI